MPEHTLRHQLKEFESELAGAKSALAKAIGTHEIEVRALKARIAVLEAALLPFSREQLSTDADFHGTRIIDIEWRDECVLRARAALSDKSPIRLVGNWTEKL